MIFYSIPPLLQFMIVVREFFFVQKNIIIFVICCSVFKSPHNFLMLVFEVIIIRMEKNIFQESTKEEKFFRVY